MKRSHKDHEDLVLVMLLALDATGHALGGGSVKDLCDMASRDAVNRLSSVRLIAFKRGGSLVLTDEGRAEARLVAARLAEVHHGP